MLCFLLITYLIALFEGHWSLRMKQYVTEVKLRYYSIWQLNANRNWYSGIFIWYISIEILHDINESSCRWYCIQDRTRPTFFFLDVKENDIIVLTHQYINQIIIRPRLALTSLSVKISISSHYCIYIYIRISANSILSWVR